MYTDELQNVKKRGTRRKKYQCCSASPTTYAYNIASCPPCRIFDGHRFGKFMDPSHICSSLVLEFLQTERIGVGGVPTEVVLVRVREGEGRGRSHKSLVQLW